MPGQTALAAQSTQSDRNVLLRPPLNRVRRNTSQSDQTGKSFLLTASLLAQPIPRRMLEPTGQNCQQQCRAAQSFSEQPQPLFMAGFSLDGGEAVETPTLIPTTNSIHISDRCGLNLPVAPGPFLVGRKCLNQRGGKILEAVQVWLGRAPHTPSPLRIF